MATSGSPTLKILAVCTVVLAAPAFASTSGPLRAFDEAVAAGLPQRVALPAGDAEARDASSGELVVTSLVEGLDTAFSDGTRGTHYMATWQGKPAVVVRSAGHLDITVADATGVSITGYSGDTERPHRLRRDGSAESAAATARAVASVADEPPTTSGLSPNPHEGLSTVGFHMFVHDDVEDRSDQHIHAGYVAWWAVDMRRILAVRRVQTVYRRRMPGLTDIPRHDGDLLGRWTLSMQRLVMREGLMPIPGHSWFKFMLLTPDAIEPGHYGRAWLGGDHAVASLNGPYTVIAHEYGHTLGGVHEDASVEWSGFWPCETNLYSHSNALRRNCYRYTPENQRRMREYMAGALPDEGERRLEMVY
ncbi:hypothetical protein SAMN04515660_3502 [Luteibacter sp. 329MFSha]|nr:hypothetical protein SAMN04515660_3502 [Luteibacter sp. 329MFSha]